MIDGIETENLEEPVSNLESEPVLSEQEEEKKEKSFPSSTVQKIVARERQKAYEKGKKEALMTLENQEMNLQQPAQAQPMQQPPNQLGGIPQQPQVSSDDISRIIAEQLPQHLQQQVEAHKNNMLIESFVNKMQAAEQVYPGLEKKLNDLDYTKPGTRALVEMANSMENTGDIMNELIENPEKMGTLLNLIYEQPRLAVQRMASLSNSIKTNQQAVSQEKQAQNPINQVKSSPNTGMSGNSEQDLSMNDLRRMFSR